jgi:uncharacterized protein (DUF302 family)
MKASTFAPAPAVPSMEGEAGAHFQRHIVTALPVEDAVSRLEKSIAQMDLLVLHRIDPQAIVRRHGYQIPAARQILFFHPRYMARLLAADPSALLEAPLKFALLALPSEETAVRWLDPAHHFARYANHELKELGRELSEVCDAIANDALSASV